MIEHGKRVTIEYSLLDSDNNILDTSKGLGPLTFTVGNKEVLPALEVALAGLQPGDTKKIALAAKEAFGAAHSTAFKPVPLSDIPEDYRQVGAVFGLTDDKGSTHQVKIDRIDDTNAILDFNHPLAGQDVVFDVLVIDVE